ncbi:MAG: zinc ribbon domain-containing protein [Eubacterium sp.]|nr:zinc ribbon domain-containing protein [Eubacterium sp.]
MIQCPNCGGGLKFDIQSQQLKCDSCNSLFDPYSVKSTSAEEETEYSVTVFRCPQCGGEICSTEETAAAFCSYCGSSNVLESRVSKEKKPELIIPFKKTKAECENLFEKFINKAIFAPTSYRRAGRADSFRGIYMPYWLYDMSQRGDVNIASSTSHRSGDYIITDHYMLRGHLDNYYNGVSYDASSTFADDISSDIAPYNVKDITTFNPSFLAGYYADLADVGVDTYKNTAIGLAQESTYNYLRKSSPMAGQGFDSPKETVKSGIRTNINVTRSAMFPVWFMSYRNRDRVAYATVNGQTGKVSADIPMSIPKYLALALGVAIGLFAILQMLFTITPKILLVIVSILGLISALSYGKEMRKIASLENHDDDLGMLDRERRIEEKKRARTQAQKGASFDGMDEEAYVITQNDIKRQKREKHKTKKAKQKTAGSLAGIITVFLFVLVGFSIFGNVLKTLVDGNSGLVTGVISLILLIIVIISAVNAKKSINDMYSVNGLPASIGSVIALLCIMIVSFWNPIDDRIWYAAAIVSMVAIIVNIIGIIRGYNLLSMRPLPQFEMYQGGDDRA